MALESSHFQAKQCPSTGMLCSAFRQRCHKHHVAEEQLDSPVLQGPHRVQIQCDSKGQWQLIRPAPLGIFLWAVGFSSPALQTQHWSCTLVEKKLLYFKCYFPNLLLALPTPHHTVSSYPSHQYPSGSKALAARGQPSSLLLQIGCWASKHTWSC